MSLNRRQFLCSAAAAVAWPAVARGSTDSITLEARPDRKQLVPAEFGDHPETGVWGFNGSVPGPLIRGKQGEMIRPRLVNALPQPTAVHWHGLRVPNEMDGVPGITQDAVPKGGFFQYELPLKDAGTYWYHSHNQSQEQVARGLYGLLVVDEPDPVEVDHDIAVVLDDWRLTQGAQIAENFGAMHDWTHAGRLGNFVHAKLTPHPDAFSKNQRLRLRFVNVATDRIMEVSLHGVSGKLVARDGMPLLQPEDLDVMVFGPAERADVIVDVTGETVQLVMHERDTGYLLEEFPVKGQHSAVPRDPVTPLPPNPIHRINSLEGARKLPLLMEGGAMGGLRQGIYKGKQMSVRELVDAGQVWTFNGVAGLPEEPFLIAERGELIRIPITNDTVFAHAMHMHGTHFQEVLPDGRFGPLRDTLLVQPREIREIAFIPDNPGDWLLHCHMLSHQAAGMKTWLRVL